MTVSAPRYRIILREFAANFGIGDVVAEIHPLNLGFGMWANEVPEAFFTVSKDDKRAPMLAAHEGRLHVQIMRWSVQPGYDEQVFAGFLGENDATERDIVFYAYGYVARLFTLLTDWDQGWENAPVGTIVSDLWTRAKTTLSDSPLAFVTTGTIETPYTETNGSTEVILPSYEAYRKRILFVMREMSAIGASDTLNTPMFEITHTATPTFNFWRNRGQDRANLRFEWGDGIISRYQLLGLPVFRRNAIHAVGSSPFNPALRDSLEHETDMAYYGRTEEPLYFAWVRDQEELHRAALIRSRLARQSHTDLTLEFYPNSTPPITPSSPLQGLLDRAKVKINDGIVDIDDLFLITGVETIFAGAEKVRLSLRKMYEADPNIFALDADRLLDDDLVLDTTA